ncbi:MAG TPA: ABC transporter ATP-binding protein [Acidobacteriota bacterium]|nr:ABC transporter ATP-binding protein [Acidobacteriota bacterium]
MQEAVVETHKLSRDYGRRQALLNVDLRLEKGEILALVGPNGSGKTTLLKILGGLLQPSAGRARVFGLDPFSRRRQVMRRTRFAFAPPPLYDQLSAREHLRLLGGLGLNGRPPTRQDVESALSMVGLLGRADDRVGSYSFGMRQRLALAQALVPPPQLLVLDEPTDGLDPLAVLELRGVLRRLRQERGLTILLSSHLLIEVEQLVDRMLVLEEGRVLYSGPPAGLRDGRQRLHLRVDQPHRAVEVLREQQMRPEASPDGTLLLPAGALSLSQAAALLEASGVRLLEFHEAKPTLEELLLERIRQARRDQGLPARGEVR